jgi:transposase InsO family protein
MQDCYNGEIISLEMRDTMKRDLCIKTVKEAYRNTGAGNGVIIHTDSGSQYTSIDYKEEIGLHRAIQSMSNVGKCYDNARIESWFATLKKEKIYKLDTAHMTAEEVKKEIWRHTFGYYNTLRVTTVTEDGLPPSVYNQKVATVKSVA